MPDDLVFVFGHTHKPFEDLFATTASRRPAEVLNTGGWVVDSIDDDSVQGAAVVLLDEQLEAVSVHCYYEGDVDTGVRVRWAGRAGPFARRITELVQAGEPAWNAVATRAVDLVAERHRVLDLNIEEGMGVEEAAAELVSEWGGTE